MRRKVTRFQLLGPLGVQSDKWTFGNLSIYKKLVVHLSDNKEDYNNNKDENNDKGISAPGLDRDFGFSPGHQGLQGHRPHDDDDNKKDNDEVEDNNNEKGISDLEEDRNLVAFLRRSRTLGISASSS